MEVVYARFVSVRARGVGGGGRQAGRAQGLGVIAPRGSAQCVVELLALACGLQVRTRIHPRIRAPLWSMRAPACAGRGGADRGGRGQRAGVQPGRRVARQGRARPERGRRGRGRARGDVCVRRHPMVTVCVSVRRRGGRAGGVVSRCARRTLGSNVYIMCMCSCFGADVTTLQCFVVMPSPEASQYLWFGLPTFSPTTRAPRTKARRTQQVPSENAHPHRAWRFHTQRRCHTYTYRTRVLIHESPGFHTPSAAVRVALAASPRKARRGRGFSAPPRARMGCSSGSTI